MEQFANILIGNTGLEMWNFWLFCAVSFAGSFITATLGLGGGMLVLAVMALFMPPAALIPVHAVVQLGSNIGRAALMIKYLLRSILPVFLLGSLVGAIVGGQLVVTMPTTLLQGILALFILWSVWAPGFQASKPGKKTFFAVAAVSSFVTMFVGATGPLVAPFVLAASNDRRQFVATHAVLMSLQHLLKLATFGILGFSFGPYLGLLAGLIGFGFAGTYLGKKTLMRLPENVFRAGLKIILTLIAVRLLYALLTTFG